MQRFVRFLGAASAQHTLHFTNVGFSVLPKYMATRDSNDSHHLDIVKCNIRVTYKLIYAAYGSG